MDNTNRINLELIPVNGVDKSVNCANCPSACCREGMVLPLTRGEAATLEDAGTQMHQLDRSESRGRRPGRGRKFYRFDSNCGNLAIDPETGQTSCEIYGSDNYPKVCTEFTMGSYACALTQLKRIDMGEDRAVEPVEASKP